jgi:hypothetical protein
MLLAALVAFLIESRRGSAVANLSKVLRIRCGNGRRPAGGDRGKNLHHQRNQKSRQIILQPPPRRETLQYPS